MAEETLKDIINEPERKSSKIVKIVLILGLVVGLIGGVYYAIDMMSNNVVTLPSIPGFKKASPTPSASPSATPSATPAASVSSAETLSDKDDTSTLKQELDATSIEDSSASDSAVLDADISQL